MAFSEPVASSTTAYFATADLGSDGNAAFDPVTSDLLSTLHAVDLETGTTIWTAPVPSVQGVALTMAGDEVVAAGAPLTAFDAATGATRWTAPSIERSQGAPAFDESHNLVVAASSTDVDAVDAGTGAVRWQAAMPAQVLLDTAQPVLVDGGTVVVATSTPGPIVGFDAANGASQWQFTAPSPLGKSGSGSS